MLPHRHPGHRPLAPESPSHTPHTRRKAGLTNFQHSLQYRPGLKPIICWMSLLNLSTPAHTQSSPVTWPRTAPATPWALPQGLASGGEQGSETGHPGHWLVQNKGKVTLRGSITFQVPPQFTSQRESRAWGCRGPAPVSTARRPDSKPLPPFPLRMLP